MRTPTTFAEAVRLAEMRMKERELSAISSFTHTEKTLGAVPRNIFGNCNLDFVQQTDSSDSVQDFSLSPCSTISATISTMSPLGTGQESQVTQQMLSLTLGSDLHKSSDSFSSLLDTAHNKGAVAFMELVEAYLTK